MSRIFISYCRYPESEVARVGDLAGALRRDGFIVVTDEDVFPQTPPAGWNVWLRNQIDQADWVLLVCTPEYARQSGGALAAPGDNRFQTVIGPQLLGDGTDPAKLIPLLWAEGTLDDVPPWLGGATGYWWPRERLTMVWRLHLARKPQENHDHSMVAPSVPLPLPPPPSVPAGTGPTPPPSFWRKVASSWEGMKTFWQTVGGMQKATATVIGTFVALSTLPLWQKHHVPPPVPSTLPGPASHPADATLAITRGKRLAAMGYVEEAYGAFTGATSADPGNATAWANLGAAAMLTGRSVEGTAAYQKAIQLDPDNWLAHYNLGCWYARSGKRDEALSEIAAAVRSVRMRQNVDLGSVLKTLRTDSALRELRHDPRFEEILAAD